jgi:NADPH-dependent 2,4-dienoyl-CoA reductase/sulfur reductase-like enzyme/peroxiredoxin family protein/TusA-related sulfurtransferase/rhodanese-related sulfurtransferase
VVSIDRKSKTVRVQPLSPETRSPEGEAFSFPYDKLLLAMGAAPWRPPIPGAAAGALPYVYTLRDLRDTDAIASRVAELEARAVTGGTAGQAVVLGAGFVGLEVVEALVRRGVAVTVVEARDHVLPAIDSDMTTALTNDLRSSGVSVVVGESASEIAAATFGAGPGGRTTTPLQVRLASGRVLPADMVLVATGVRPETSLATAAGIDLDAASRAISVNEHLQTSDEDIYAVGDAVAAPNFFNPSKRCWLPMGGPANRQARLAADHIVLADKADAYRGNVGTAIVRAFNTTVGVTGMTEQALARAGRGKDTYGVVAVTGYSHASYFPGAQPVTLKVVYDTESRKVLGAQASGGTEGVDKRLDVLATSILLGGTVDDLAHLELSYAPQFGSARDVLNTAGFAARNVSAGLVRPERSLAALPADRVILDVRDRTSSGLHPVRAPGGQTVVSLPHEELRAAVGSLDKDKSYTTVCSLGKLSYFGARTLSQLGFGDVTSLTGGIRMNEGPVPDAPAVAHPSEVASAASAAALAAARPHHLHSTTVSATPHAVASHATATVGALNVTVDACGLACPGPIAAMRKALPGLAPGGTLTALATDPGFFNDVKAFASTAGLSVDSLVRSKGIITAVLRNNGGAPASHAAAPAAPAASPLSPSPPPPPASVFGGADAQSLAAPPPAINTSNVAIVVFSGEMDKVLAALVIANGAIAMGGTANLFFTFWGLPALKRDGTFKDIEALGSAADSAGEGVVGDGTGPGEKKILLTRMMSAMLPSGPSHLPLSHMNYGGMGPQMMKAVMASKHLPTVPGLLHALLDAGPEVARITACTMSMDAMGVAAADLLHGVQLGGVADFIASAGKAHTTLFI